MAPRRSRPALAGVLVLSGGDRRDQIEKITTALSAAAAAAALATVARASIDSPPPPSSEPEAAIEPAENRSVTPRERRLARIERIALAVTQAPLTRFLMSASICWMAFASYEINRDMQVFTKPAKAIEDSYNAAQKRVNRAVRKARKEGAPVATQAVMSVFDATKPSLQMHECAPSPSTSQRVVALSQP